MHLERHLKFHSESLSGGQGQVCLLSGTIYSVHWCSQEWNNGVPPASSVTMAGNGGKPITM